jgi:hypothetical protein
MDRAIDPATAQERRLGGVDDGIDRERGDVGHDDLEPRRPNLGGEKRCGHGRNLPRLTANA